MSENNSQNMPFGEGIFHILFWLLTIHFFFDVEGLFYSFKGLFVIRDTMIVDEAFILLPISISLFYWNLLYLIPKFLNKGNWIPYCISLLLSYVFACYLSEWIYGFIVDQNFVFRISEQEISDFSIVLYLQILVASTTLGVAKIAFRNLSLKREAERSQKEAELKYLANQFNPHFLHNTLNGIYSKAIEENAPETTEAILMLSEIMRYPINQGLKNQVPLTEEVKFIEDYIALQRLRLGDDYPIQFEKEKNLEGINILPLSLIVLVENSFKYGVSPKNQSPISFQLKLMNDHILFTAENHFKNNENISSHNIGLQNLKTRLGLMYNDKYHLQTEMQNDKYIVHLELREK